MIQAPEINQIPQVFLKKEAELKRKKGGKQKKRND
jgi:hypothetical protein